MKKIVFMLFLGLTLLHPIKAKANEIVKVTATAYAPTGNLTYTETVPRFGVAAGKKDWLGKTAIVWFDDGDGAIKPENYYSTFVFEDLGGSKAIRNGYVIDIFMESEETAIQFGSKKVIVQIVESEG